MENRIKKKPAKDVKGRKEGRGGLHLPRISSCDPATGHDKENASVASDGKRKRSSAAIPTGGRALSDAHSSPFRKASRLGDIPTQDFPTKAENTIDDLTVDGVVMRAPLADVGNSF